MEDYDADRAEMLERASQAGVTHILCPAVSSATHDRLLELCGKYPKTSQEKRPPLTCEQSGADDNFAPTAVGVPTCRPMMGVHPTEVNGNEGWREELEIVEDHLATGRFCAVGEVGIDLHWSHDFLPQQTEAFERQIELALRYDLPIAVHCRDAWAETLAVLERYRGRNLRGVMHAFSGGMAEYQRVTALGDFVFGVGGPVTYKRNLWPELLPQMAREHIVLETDAPWLAPVPHRGERNEPAWLTYIQAAVAAILSVSEAEVDESTTQNAKRIFGL